MSQFKSRPLAERFWERVEKQASGCWVWMGYRQKHGYGTIAEGGRRGKMFLVHRVSWRLHFGPIPPETLVCHHCDNRPCVNPAHLFLGTNADNMADMIAKDRQSDRAGVKNGRAKLTPNDVVKIRELRNSKIPQWHIAQQFGVSRSLIGAIEHRLLWPDV